MKRLQERQWPFGEDASEENAGSLIRRWVCMHGPSHRIGLNTYPKKYANREQI
jgi:hypothetical protein